MKASSTPGHVTDGLSGRLGKTVCFEDHTLLVDSAHTELVYEVRWALCLSGAGYCRRHMLQLARVVSDSNFNMNRGSKNYEITFLMFNTGSIRTFLFSVKGKSVSKSIQ